MFQLRSYALTVLGVVFSGQIFGQLVNPPEIEWEKTYDCSEDDEGESVQKTDDGGYIITGFTSKSGVFLLKTNAGGELDQSWTENPRLFNDSILSGGSVGTSVRQTTDGGYIIGGSNIPLDLFLIKTDVLGAPPPFNFPKVYYTWNYHESAGSVLEIDDGYILKFYRVRSIPPSNEGENLIMKAKKDGTQNWIKPLTGSGYENRIVSEMYKLTEDGGAVYIGRASTLQHFEHGSYLMKRNLSTNLEWVKFFGDESCHARSVDLTNDGGYIVVGKATNTGSTNSDVHLVKFNRERIQPQKTPVIVIPGFPGTEMYDDTTGNLVWLDLERLLDINDPWLLRLLLQEDGITPDSRLRCLRDLTLRENNCTDCIVASMPACVSGGRPMRVGGLIHIENAFTGYKSLVDFLDNNGYTPEKDLFRFPYDWRLNLEASAYKLGIRIKGDNQRKGIAPNPGDKVSIIAHSMGGLVVRAYIQQCLREEKDHRIDAVIFLGTPHQGSPYAYAILEGYKPILGLYRKAWPRDLNWWLELNTQTLISQNFPSIYQVLPWYNFRKINGIYEPYIESYNNLNDNNPYLVDEAKKFHEFLDNTYTEDIKYYSILGTAQKTLQGFSLEDGKCNGLVLDFYGDGTVPNISGTSFGYAKNFFVIEEHSALPGNPKVQEKILVILDKHPEKRVDGIFDEPKRSVNNDEEEIRRLTTCSPITIKIIDEQGNITGTDDNGKIKEHIPEGEFYRFAENQAGYIPYDGNYVVEIKGVSTGEFTLIIETLKDNEAITEIIEYTNIPVVDVSTGILNLSPTNPAPGLFYDVDGDSKDDFTLIPWQEAPHELQNMFSKKGDVNQDGSLDISDAISILGYLFLGSKIECKNAGDVNTDGDLDISDPISLLGFLFLGEGQKPEGKVFCPTQ